MRPRAVLLIRVSSTKQAIENNSDGRQLTSGIIFIKSKGWEVARSMNFVESGRKEDREFFEEVIEYCTNPSNKIKYLVARDISRITRQGEIEYIKLKERLHEAGVRLQDTKGTILPSKNTLEELGVKYDWSEYYPSEGEEIQQARQARDRVRDSLTLMIGAEIDYERMGYWNRPPPYGYANQKVQTQKHGVRNILIDNKNESVFIKKMFQMRTSGMHSDKEIVAEINKLGYRSRRITRRSKKTKQMTGYGGEKVLIVKQMQRFIRNPAYVGIVCTKWTHYKPVKGLFEGLVGVDTFNEANRGKIVISYAPDNSPNIKYGKERLDGKVIQTRTKNNPAYPYKNVVMCPLCKLSLRGSATRGKMGEKYPAYHCNRGHKYWRVSQEEFHNTVYDFIRKLKFSDTYIKMFEATVLEVIKEKRDQSVEESVIAERSVADLLIEQKDIRDSIKLTRNRIVIRDLENDYEAVEDRIKEARSTRNKKEGKEINYKQSIKQAVYLMEHLEELLIDKGNPMQQQQLFGLAFDEFPTYTQLVNGTPKLSLAFKLNQQQNLSKSQLVSPLSPRWNTFSRMSSKHTRN